MASQRNNRESTYWPGTVLSVFVGLVLSSAVYLLAPVLVGGEQAAVHLLRILAWLLIPAGVQVSLRALRQAERRYRLLNREPMIGSVARLVALLALSAAGWLNLVTAASVTALSMFGTIFLLGKPPHFGSLRTLIRLLPDIKTRLTQSAILLLGSVAAILTGRVDQLLLTPLAGARELGLYAVAVTLAELPLVATEAIRQILLTEAAARRDVQLVVRASRLLFAALAVMGLVGALVAPLVLPLVFGPPFASAALPTGILLAGTVCMVPGTLMATGLLALGRPLLSALPMFVGVAVTVAVAPIAIVWLGATGAALASLLAYACLSTVSIAMFAKVHNVSAIDCLLVRRADIIEARRAVRSSLRRERPPV